MLISKLVVPETETSATGLSAVNMTRLGRFVAIAGKNGAGKSRLLEILNLSVAGYNDMLANRVQWNENRRDTLQAIQNQPDSIHCDSWRRKVTEYDIALARSQYIVPRGANGFKALRFVPKQLNLVDPMSQTMGQIVEAHNGAASSAIDAFAGQCLSYVQNVQNMWWNTSHQEFVGSASEKQRAAESYRSLDELIKRLLGASLTRSAEGATLIFNKPLAKAGLSDGQKIILQFLSAIHAKGASLDNTIFILDELENHLHPSVTIDLLEKITAAAPQAQIWVATHSIPLLAYIVSVDPMALWYMESGTITHAGRHPEKVLQSLLGDAERIGQLNSFTGLPAQLAATNFAVESLMPPLTVAGGQNDPQVNQIAKVIQRTFHGSPPVVLDFGAGQGRLLEGIAAFRTKHDADVGVDYLALDDSPKDREACISVIGDHFSDPECRHFPNIEQFFAARDDNSIDVIVMCNVLHEIPPQDWIPILSRSTSLVQRALKDDGYLLLVEDQRIPVGEKAHEQGFLVLDTAQLKTLFAITKTDIDAELFVSDDHRHDGRLKAHLIARPLLARLNSDTRSRAIVELQSSCLERIREIRQQVPSYASGQLHGFWTQQFANAHMYLLQN